MLIAMIEMANLVARVRCALVILLAAAHPVSRYLCLFLVHLIVFKYFQITSSPRGNEERHKTAHLSSRGSPAPDSGRRTIPLSLLFSAVHELPLLNILIGSPSSHGRHLSSTSSLSSSHPTRPPLAHNDASAPPKVAVRPPLRVLPPPVRAPAPAWRSNVPMSPGRPSDQTLPKGGGPSSGSLVRY